jgi:hypothetical protein
LPKQFLKRLSFSKAYVIIEQLCYIKKGYNDRKRK